MITVWVLGDQLNMALAAMADADPSTHRVLLVESGASSFRSGGICSGRTSFSRRCGALRRTFGTMGSRLMRAGPHRSMQESLTSLGDRPLVVVTAEKEAEDGWMAAQDELATLSTNSVHRVVPDATHAMLTENEAIAVQSSQAIRDVVNAVRTGTPVAK